MTRYCQPIREQIQQTSIQQLSIHICIYEYILATREYPKDEGLYSQDELLTYLLCIHIHMYI